MVCMFAEISKSRLLINANISVVDDNAAYYRILKSFDVYAHNKSISEIIYLSWLYSSKNKSFNGKKI